jgi:lysophospholipase L1-like esterase
MTNFQFPSSEEVKLEKPRDPGAFAGGSFFGPNPIRRTTGEWGGAIRYIPLLVYAAIFSNARFFFEESSGMVTWLLAAGMVSSPILAAREIGALVASRVGLARGVPGLTRLALLLGGAMTAFVLLEAGLQIAALVRNPEDKASLSNALTLPKEWERRPANVPGAASAYYWHGVLHVHNEERMRLVGKFPSKRPGTFRILALGDSLTYGYGIAPEDTYPSVVERELNRLFRVEVLNLGVSGAQSEDVYRILQRHLSILQPDLVLYGVCLNDFLPSGVGQYERNRAYQVPLPYGEQLARRTLAGGLLERQYDLLLMRLGLRVDFLTDILRDFQGYQTRFAKDVAAMNAVVRARGLPPVFAMVLEQYPDTRGKRYEVALAAERHLRAGGIRVIPSEYIRRHDGRDDWYVSRWEGHPNEKANRVFGQEIAKALLDLPELRAYRR